MVMVLYIMAACVAVMAVYHFLTRKYLNPYKLIMIFGKKGSGKTTLLTKLALDYLKQGIPVYSTEKIPGVFLINYEDLGYTHFPEGSVLLIDEAGMKWDNRNFKNFDPKLRDFLKLQRHYKLRVYLFSQTFDVDKKIRDLTDEMYLVEKKFRVFSYAKRILKRIVLTEATADGPSKIDENLVFDSLLLFWCGSRKFTFIPKYAKMFDSFETTQLLEKEYEVVPLNAPDSLREGKLQQIMEKLKSVFAK